LTNASTSSPSTVTAPTNNGRDDCEEQAENPSPSRQRKKRKRNAAADEIDALFDDAIGRKVVRGALDLAPTPTPVLPKSKTKGKGKAGEKGKREEKVERHADLEAIVDAIRVAPSGEGKGRGKRRAVSGH